MQAVMDNFTNFAAIMKQMIVILTLLACSLTGHAQAAFKLQQTGTFVTAEGNDYAVIAFEGKKAEELYQMVKDNVAKYYESPEDVLTEEPHTKLTVEGFNREFLMWTFMMVPTQFGALYTLTFQFKDGRIRVDAPEIDDTMMATATFGKKGATASFKSMLNTYFRNGEVKEKAKPKVAAIEQHINDMINRLLTQESPKAEDDW